MRLAERPGVVVTGTIDDIWSYVNGIDIFVFPLWRGVGVKNKIIEAMYARRPVVTTLVGNEGIEGTVGRDLLVCHTAEEFGVIHNGYPSTICSQGLNMGFLNFPVVDDDDVNQITSG